MEKSKGWLITLLGLVVVTLVSGCASDSWLGTSDQEEVVEGKRVAVLEADPILTPDAAVVDKQVIVPDSEDVNVWSRSQGYHYTLPGNIAIEQPKNIISNVSIGDSLDPYYLSNAPIVVGEFVYTIDAQGLVKALNHKNKMKRLWEYQIEIDEDEAGNFTNAGMNYNQGVLYITSGYDKVLALDATSGKLLWIRNINSIARSSPSVINGMLMVNTIDNRLYALDASDGGLVWTHSGIVSDVSMFGSTAPVARGDIVFVPYSSGEIYAIHVDSGRTIWSDIVSSQQRAYSSISDIHAAPILYKNHVISVSSDGVMAAFEAKTGSRTWQTQLKRASTPWVAGDFAYLITQSNELVCLFLPTGAIRWVRQLTKFEDIEDQEGPITWNGPVMGAGSLWIVSSHGKLLELSAQDGQTISQLEVNEDIYLSPVLANGAMFLLTQDARLLKLGK